MKISFTDFWGGNFPFMHHNNMLLDIFKQIDNEIKLVPLSDDTDILIYSCFGDAQHHRRANRKKTKKIFYTGENKRPNFDECDFSLSFDFESYNGKNIRLPLWYLYIDWFNKGGYGNPKYIMPPNQIDDNNFIKKEKKKFCSFVYSHSTPQRTEFFDKLKPYKSADGFGLPFGSHTWGEDIKYNIISDYKFNMCFENTVQSGYHTEKLLHAKTAGCIPLYWGADTISEDFNKKCFINLLDFDNDIDKFIEYIKEVDNNDNLYNEILNEPLFTSPPHINNIIDDIKKIIL